MGSSNNHQNYEVINSKQAQVAVALVPFPAQGHLNQLLQLACAISSYGLPVHYLGSATHNRQAKIRAKSSLNALDIAKINFHDLPTPAFHSPPPNPKAGKKFPGHLQPSFDASLQLREPVATILRRISSESRRTVVIYDFLMAAVVQDAASISNAERYQFSCLSVLNHFVWDSEGRPFQTEWLPKEMASVSVEDCITDEFGHFIFFQSQHNKSRAGILFNSCRLIEETYIDLLMREKSGETRNLWAVGPLLPLKSSTTTTSNPSDQDGCLAWLEKQPPNSVIYVSFGTTTSMTSEEIKELAIGLEESGQKFIWVLRYADRGDIFAGEHRRIELPGGFEERIEGDGMVIRDWAPQLEILAHPATGGFMSHCGWNSCTESISLGVPIAAWPMHSDQPWNAFLVVEKLKIGLMVREWAKHKELVNSSAVADSVRKLMASEEGEDIRKRAEELGTAVRQSTQEGGGSRLELDSFIAHVTR